MGNGKIISVKSDATHLIIKISRKDLVFAIENNNGLWAKVIDVDLFVSDFIDTIQTPLTSNQTETGISSIESCFDEVFESMCDVSESIEISYLEYDFNINKIP